MHTHSTAPYNVYVVFTQICACKFSTDGDPYIACGEDTQHSPGCPVAKWTCTHTVRERETETETEREGEKPFAWLKIAGLADQPVK